MKRVSFDGIGQVLATFEAEEGVKAGQTVEMSGDGTVKLCANGKRPAGVAVAVRDGCAAVQVRGFVTVKAAGVTARSIARIRARYYRDEVLPAMEEARRIADELEGLVAKDAWPMPTYSDILFYI